MGHETRREVAGSLPAGSDFGAETMRRSQETWEVVMSWKKPRRSPGCNHRVTIVTLNHSVAVHAGWWEGFQAQILRASLACLCPGVVRWHGQA